MSRAVRMVPRDWEHPQTSEGHYKPLFEGCDVEALQREWDEGAAQWEANPEVDCTWEEWCGHRPDSETYMPCWPEGQADHFMMYEEVTEGTPISPAFATPEQLARWLADNKASAFADRTATYGEWLDTIKRGSAVSAVMVGGSMMSGVEFEARENDANG